MLEAAKGAQQSTNEFSLAWTVVIGAALGTAIGVSALPYYSQGLFITELETAFGWTRSQLTLAFMMKTLGLAAASPLIGALVDKYGVRGPAIASYLCLGVCFVLLGVVVESYWHLLILYALLAFFGAGTSPVMLTRVINGWFTRSRGLALGLTLTGTGLTATFVPAVLSRVIDQFGWRGGYMALGLLVLAVFPLVIALLKPNPEEARTIACSTGAEVDGVSLQEARKSRLFWTLMFSFFLLASAISGLLVHFIPLLISEGISRQDAATTAGLIGVAVILGRVLVGFLVDRLFAPYVAVGLFTLCAVGCLLLSVFGSAAAPFAAIAIGLGMGGEVDLIGYFTVRYFGLTAYGRLYGWQYAGFIIGSGVGPLWIGISYDLTGSYSLALIISAVILFVICGIFMSLPRFRY